MKAKTPRKRFKQKRAHRAQLSTLGEKAGYQPTAEDLAECGPVRTCAFCEKETMPVALCHDCLNCGASGSECRFCGEPTDCLPDGYCRECANRQEEAEARVRAWEAHQDDLADRWRERFQGE